MGIRQLGVPQQLLIVNICLYVNNCQYMLVMDSHGIVLQNIRVQQAPNHLSVMLHGFLPWERPVA